MVRQVFSLLIALLLAVSGGLGAAVASAEPLTETPAPPTPYPTPNTDACPQRQSPPPPVNDSETVPPGETPPTPLPVPDPPLGGDRMDECGVVADPAAGPLPEHIASSAWLIADLDTGAIIAAKDPHGRYRPASTIKLLLALVAVEELDFDTEVTGTVNDYSIIGDSCGMGPGGTYTVEQLVTGLMVVSGNDCANALARELGGYQETLDKMNAKAAELQALDTRAASPSGLDAAGMSTSAYDLALIFRAAYAQPEIAEMLALDTYEFPGYPGDPDDPADEDRPGWTMGNSNSMLRAGYPGMLGGKTGYTDSAEKTFVGAAERDGRRLLIVQLTGLNEPGNSYTEQADRLFAYGFAADPDIEVGSLVAAADPADRPVPSGSARSEMPSWFSEGIMLALLILVTCGVIIVAGGYTIVRGIRRRR